MYLRIRGYHPLWPEFPFRSAWPMQTTGLLRVRSPLLAESLLMSFPPGTEMFQFPGFASPTYVFSERYPIGVGCPIRISTDQSLLAAPHGFSQRATSFIASWCQGIHRMPLSRSISDEAANHPTLNPPCTGTIHTQIRQMQILPPTASHIHSAYTRRTSRHHEQPALHNASEHSLPRPLGSQTPKDPLTGQTSWHPHHALT